MNSTFKNFGGGGEQKKAVVDKLLTHYFKYQMSSLFDLRMETKRGLNVDVKKEISIFVALKLN